VDRTKLSEDEAFEHAIDMISSRQMGFRKAADFFQVRQLAPFSTKRIQPIKKEGWHWFKMVYRNGFFLHCLKEELRFCALFRASGQKHLPLSILKQKYFALGLAVDTVL
jgi:hypothetical protein